MRYRKLPVEIDAIEWTGMNPYEISGFTGQPIEREGDSLKIWTLEGVMLANKGDFIIKGVAGEFYPCKPEIFAKTYEPVRTKEDQPTNKVIGVLAGNFGEFAYYVMTKAKDPVKKLSSGYVRDRDGTEYFYIRSIDTLRGRRDFSVWKVGNYFERNDLEEIDRELDFKLLIGDILELTVTKE